MSSDPAPDDATPLNLNIPDTVPCLLPPHMALGKDLPENPYPGLNKTLWDQCLELLKERMSLPSFETWIAPLKPGMVTEDSLVLYAATPFNRDWVLKNYAKTIQQALAQLYTDGEPPKLDILLDTTAPVISDEEGFCLIGDDTDSTQPVIQAKPTTWTPRTTQSNLNPKYTFEQFVVGQGSRFCHAAALAVAETPAQSYNPFFIYGGVGLGKTHLMQAIGHFALKHHSDKVVRYLTAEQFTNDLISALTKKDMKSFRDKYRKNDILIIDDIQFLEGKERTQEEVFHTFNALHESGKQIILSSDRPPKSLSRLEDRLRSRFEWGLIADIQPPDLETRLAILKQKALRENKQVPEEVLQYVAEQYPLNVRELEGAFNKVVAYSLLTHAPLNLASAQTVLGIRLDPNTLSLDDILATVADFYHMHPTDIKGPSRTKDVAHARQMAIYMLRTLTEGSFPKLGEFLGGRKHTTILYAYEKIKEEIQHSTLLGQQTQELKRRIELRMAR
jgi:chromosomal replication initiator protein